MPSIPLPRQSEKSDRKVEKVGWSDKLPHTVSFANEIFPCLADHPHLMQSLPVVAVEGKVARPSDLEI